MNIEVKITDLLHPDRPEGLRLGYRTWIKVDDGPWMIVPRYRSLHKVREDILVLLDAYDPGALTFDTE